MFKGNNWYTFKKKERENKMNQRGKVISSKRKQNESYKMQLKQAKAEKEREKTSSKQVGKIEVNSTCINKYFKCEYWS